MQSCLDGINTALKQGQPSYIYFDFKILLETFNELDSIDGEHVQVLVEAYNLSPLIIHGISNLPGILTDERHKLLGYTKDVFDEMRDALELQDVEVNEVIVDSAEQ